ncbi:hypothetical protein D8B24_09315 [Verminephrobacter aporrectodeae subsp. tuberculatae]|nr:hypothetical protein [Verminephrobacter aporrectodeae subsp. tuberculatae]
MASWQDTLCWCAICIPSSHEAPTPKSNMSYFHMLSHSVSAVNEDVVGFSRDEGWVLDGATSISGRRRETSEGLETDASWFVREFSKGLSHRSLEPHLQRWATSELQKLEADGPLNWENWSHTDVPSASFAHVTLKPGSSTFLNLGDCKIIYQVDGGPISFFGSSEVHKFDHALLGEYLKVRKAEPGMTHQQAWKHLVPTIRANRQRMNTSDGYWILSPDGKGLPYMQRKEVPFSSEMRAILLTDGLYRLVDTYFSMDAETFFSRTFEPAGLSILVQELRSLEDADPNAELYPRVKLQDDASALLVSNRI